MIQKGSKIAIGSDHAGYDMKEAIKDQLQADGYDVIDMGTHDKNSCDYPDFAAAVAHAVAQGQAPVGIIVCSTGIGVSMTANKVHGIRAALVHHAYEAEMTRRHNDANVLCLGANITEPQCRQNIPRHRFRRRTSPTTRRQNDGHRNNPIPLGEL